MFKANGAYPAYSCAQSEDVSSYACVRQTVRANRHIDYNHSNEHEHYDFYEITKPHNQSKQNQLVM